MLQRGTVESLMVGSFGTVQGFTIKGGKDQQANHR